MAWDQGSNVRSFGSLHDEEILFLPSAGVSKTEAVLNHMKYRMNKAALFRTTLTGPVVKNPSATREIGSVPGLGRFHVAQGNEACAPQLLKPVCSGA